MASQEIRPTALQRFSARTRMASLPKKYPALAVEFFDPASTMGPSNIFCKFIKTPSSFGNDGRNRALKKKSRVYITHIPNNGKLF
jgi:hypothetical protein